MGYDYDVEFWVSLIKVANGNNPAAKAALEDNCTHVKGSYWIFEGETDCLEDYGVAFEIVGEGAVGCLGGLSQEELVAVCLDDLCVDLSAVEETCQK